MFDVIQIAWWFLQVTLIGYLCNYRLLRNDTDRLLFAPATGMAGGLILCNLLWMWNFPSHAMSFMWVSSLGLSALFVGWKRPKPALPAWLWLCVGVTLVALHGSLIPFTEKLWQGYPLDRFGFLSTHVLFQQEKLSYFTDAVARITYNGEKQAFFLHPMISAAFGEMKSRPAGGLLFGALAWLTPYDLHRLGNAWEVLIRAVQFASVLALFFRGRNPRFLAGFLAVGAVFGYWFQYVKDYNSWPHMITMALVLAIVGLLVSIVNARETIGKERFLVYLLTLAMLVNHAEFALVLCLGLTVAGACDETLRRELLMRKAFLIELAVLLTLVWVVHPFVMEWIHRMFLQSPGMIGGESAQARGLYSLFSLDKPLNEFTNQVVKQPFRLLTDPVALADIAIGSMGFSFVSYVGGSFTLGVGLCIVAWLALRAGDRRQARVIRWIAGATLTLGGLALMSRGGFWPHPLGIRSVDIIASLWFGGVLIALLVYGVWASRRPSFRLLFTLSFFHFVFFMGCLIAFAWFGVLGAGAAYRSLAFWGVFASLALTLLLASTEARALQFLAVVFSLFNLAFGFSIFWFANHGGMEVYPVYYPNRSGVRHFEVARVRDKYDYDYLSLMEPLRRCNLVYLDFKEIQMRGQGRFHAVNLMSFLENNRIRYRLGFAYLNAYQLLGESYHPGFKREEVHADCVVDQELRDGRLGYRLTSNDWR